MTLCFNLEGSFGAQMDSEVGRRLGGDLWRVVLLRGGNAAFPKHCVRSAIQMEVNF